MSPLGTLGTEFRADERLDTRERGAERSRVVTARLREVGATAALAADLLRDVSDEFARLHLADLVSRDAGNQRDLVSRIHRREHDDRALELVLELVDRVAQRAGIGAVDLCRHELHARDVFRARGEIGALPARELVLERAIFL